MAEPNPFGGVIENLSVDEVRKGLADGTILLVDVREPNELAAESIPGAVDFPLSTFDADALPDAGDRMLVFSCRSGQRSQRAAAAAQAAGLDLHRHMAGGILAWKQAGFPTEQG
ncbi:rhodanese-like domain-containing protein [Ancylobacter sp. 6x-1]|uniref:Rhodanese-like domain-containing protein n=1 Tax=Ancylobacter crimeensis TaxID=2579147 RepID=A0ABT0D866_9HYPH|nr:rhodanese-like domain-containing protein [Ancylobacter crimeensis]MCK0196143.1 rhodanese-like domain-containing protein [Ancylobacter crimeensis]